MYRVIILAIGNELLIGETLDTNTNWLCRHLTTLGFEIENCLILPDKINIISKVIYKILNSDWIDSQPDIIFITGGLGPTDDDLTLAAIAQALDLQLEMNETAYLWIKEKYETLAKKSFVSISSMNPARDKMAILPKNTTPIQNPVGVAPAIQITHKNTLIISLPGVPEEMKGFVLGPVEAILSDRFGVSSYREEEMWVHCGDESILAPILRQVSLAHPEVYIKSKAKGFGQNLRFQIKLHLRGQKDLIDNTIKAAIDELKETLKKNNIEID